MQKLMTAGVVLALVLSVYSASVATKYNRDMNRTVVSVARLDEQMTSSMREVLKNQDEVIDVFNDVFSKTNKLSLLNTMKTMIKELDEEVGKEIHERKALEKVVEQNAKELLRISGNLERDGDKMYTNIVMFGVSVFDVKNDMADLAVRIQDLERKALPTVVPASPSARMEEWNPLKARAGKPASDAAPE